MKAAAFLAAAVLLVAPSVHGRLFTIASPSELVAKAKLVFVGRVTAVQPSGISTTLSYVPWDGVTFNWVAAKVEVVEPFKGTRKGEIVRTAMLATDQELRNHPFVLKAENDDVFLFCLLPTPVTNLFAALTAPYNEALSVIALHRVRSYTQGIISSMEGKQEYINEMLVLADKRYSTIFDLVDEGGNVAPVNVEHFRTIFAAELADTGSPDLMPLQWQTAVSIGGWRFDVPMERPASTGSNNLNGPVLSK